MDASYIARYMMSAKERRKLEAHMNKVEYKRKSRGNGSTGIGIASTMMLGNNPLSNAGVSTAGSVSLGIDAAFLAYSLFGPDGSADHVSKIYVPYAADGQAINTAEEAAQYVKSYTVKRIKLFAETEGRSLSCIYNCDGNVTIYKLLKKGFVGTESYDAMRQGTEIPVGEYYDPPVLYVLLVGTELKGSATDRIRDSILGFTPKWETRYPNGWQINLVGDFARDVKGNITFIDHKHFGELPSYIRYAVEKAPVGRRFLRTVTGGDNLIYRGNSDLLISTFAMKGRVYNINTRNFNYFINFEISPTTDLAIK